MPHPQPPSGTPKDSGSAPFAGLCFSVGACSSSVRCCWQGEMKAKAAEEHSERWGSGWMGWAVDFDKF